MYIYGQGNIGYITVEESTRSLIDPSFAEWDAENSMVMTWLVNSMVEDIRCNYRCYSTTKELWVSVLKCILFWQPVTRI